MVIARVTSAEPGLPRFTGWLRPIVDAVARIHLGISRKLLFGFLAGALLVVGMAILSLVVMNRMNSRLEEFDRAQVKASRAQEMLYAVTAQSHYRAMALLTVARGDRCGTIGSTLQKARFAGLLEDMEQDEPDESEFVQRLIADNERYEESGERGVGAVRSRQHRGCH